MPFFQAIDTATGINAQGAKAPLASAGPYYVASWTPNARLVLRRNPNYSRAKNRFATRPANYDAIEYDANINLDAQVLRLGQADFAAEGISPSAHADLARQYGINRRQYQVRQIPTTYYVAINTTRGIFRDANVRKAINLAIDRQAMLAQRGYLAGSGRPDPPRPASRASGREHLAAEVHRLNRAKQLMRGRTAKALMLAGNRGASLTIPQIVKFNLGKIGIDMDVQHLASGPLSSTAGRREPFELYLGGWHADYPDPNNFVDILLNGNNIREANNNIAYFNVPSVNRRLEAAAKLTGQRRYAAYGQLDVDISRNYAPWASYSYANNRDFVSTKVGCYSYHPTFGMNLVPPAGADGGVARRAPAWPAPSSPPGRRNARQARRRRPRSRPSGSPNDARRATADRPSGGRAARVVLGGRARALDHAARGVAADRRARAGAGAEGAGADAARTAAHRRRLAPRGARRGDRGAARGGGGAARDARPARERPAAVGSAGTVSAALLAAAMAEFRPSVAERRASRSRSSPPTIRPPG